MFQHLCLKSLPFLHWIFLSLCQKSVGYICVGLFSVSLFHFLLKDDKWYCILFSVSPCSSKEIQPMSGSWCWITQPCWTQPAVLTRLSRFPGVLDTDYHGTWHRYAFAFSFPLSTCLPLLALVYWLDLLALRWTATVAVYIFVFTFKSLINCDVRCRGFIGCALLSNPVEEVPLISVYIVCGHYGFPHPKIPSQSASFFSTFQIHVGVTYSSCT